LKAEERLAESSSQWSNCRGYYLDLEHLATKFPWKRWQTDRQTDRQRKYENRRWRNFTVHWCWC